VSQALSPVSVYTVVAGASAIVTGLLTVFIYREASLWSPESTDRWYSDLTQPFLVLLILFTMSAAVYALAAADGKPGFGFAGVTAVLLVLPWTVFALRQVGRGYLLTRWRLGTLVIIEVPVVVTLVLALGSGTGDVPELLNLSASLLTLIFWGIAMVTAGLLLLATYRHGSVTIGSGVVVVLLFAELMIPAQAARPSLPVFSAALTAASYGAFAVTAVVAVVRYDILSVRPGTGTLGERAVVNEMSEPVLVVDPQGTIGQSNETAKELFGDGIDGEQFADVLKCSITEMAESETLERWTERGRVRFDPRVSPLTHGDRTLGYAVTLINVTDRELRKQRIQVLNRILRHNIRNNLDVIKARAQATTENSQPTQKQVDTILQVADSLEALSADARRIEKLMQRSHEETVRLSLGMVIESVIDTVETDQAVVTVDIPAISLQVDEELLRFALRNLVENAIEHNDRPEPHVDIRAERTETGLTLTVSDNGPGVPASERNVIEAESEGPLAHATSIGLWGTNWAVQTLGGELSFGESESGGASVQIDIPATAIVSESDGNMKDSSSVS
jgi:signal transduction histidine kinase